jgi:hypothetical protein
VHVEASIYEAYIVEEISIFISYYFEPHFRMRINCVPRHDDDEKVSSSENLSIFSHLRRSLPKKYSEWKIFDKIEFRNAYNYVLFNCDELRPFI